MAERTRLPAIRASDVVRFTGRCRELMVYTRHGLSHPGWGIGPRGNQPLLMQTSATLPSLPRLDNEKAGFNRSNVREVESCLGDLSYK